MKIQLLTLCLVVMLNAAELLTIGDKAPTFFMKNMNTAERQMIDIASELEKGNGVVLSFFASWCIPCRQELPYLQQVADSLDNVSLIAICVDTSWAEPQKNMIADLAITKPVLSDRMLIIAKKYGWTGKLPYSVYVRRDGTISAISDSFTENEKPLIRKNIISTIQ